MLTLSAKIRKKIGKKTKSLRKEGVLPAVLYGPKIKNLNLELDFKEFEKIFKEAGESSLIKLKIKNRASIYGSEGEKEDKVLFDYQKSKTEEFLVLIHEIQFDPLTGKPIHVDFYQPLLEEEIEVKIPLVFEGEAPAVKESGGTLVKNISELTVKAKPQNLPHEIKVNIEKLKTFEDHILIKDLPISNEVKILREPDEIVASVAPPEKIEEELAKPIEEKVEEVEKVEEKKVEEKEEEEKEKEIK